MGIVDLFLIGVGLSMDAFAVSVCKGLAERDINWRRALVTALFFGGFQAFMPLIGWALGTSVEAFIGPIDHWIAFTLLAIIGAKMIWDAFHESEEATPSAQGTRAFLAELVVLSIATSIDALVAGISFAMASIDIVTAICVIGVTTFVLSLIGTLVGNKFGSKFDRAASIAGGVALIILGLKILLEHLGVF